MQSVILAATLDQKLVEACVEAEGNKPSASTTETEAAWSNIAYDVVGLPAEPTEPLAGEFWISNL